MEYRIARFLIRLLGLVLALRIYNLFASDTRRARGGVFATSAIKQPPFYDISHWKIVTDWAGISPHPLLMGTKATQGTSYKDPTFIEYFQNFTTLVNCRRLAYHYFEKTMNPVTQANWFADFIAPYITNKDVLCLDFEQGGETAQMLWAFLDQLRKRFPSNLIIIYSRKNLMDPIVMTGSEMAFFKEFPTWPAGYPTDYSSYTTCPPGYIPRQDHWGAVWAWQYTDQGPVYGIENGADSNLMEQPFITWIGAPPPTGDTVTTPFLGVSVTKGRRNNSDMWMSVIDPLKARIKILHEHPFYNGLFLVSIDSDKNGAQMAWNGMDYDKQIPLPAYPYGPAYSDGVKYRDRADARPALNVMANGTTELTHVKTNREYNTTAGGRYILENGVPPAYLNGPEAVYKERHPRTLVGWKQDGKVLILTVDGRTSKSAGMTLLEGAKVMLEFGAWKAHDAGGGGDTVFVMKGVIQNVPCDTGINGQPGVERAVPQAILVYATEENPMPTTFRFEATAIGANTRIRTGPSTGYPYKNSYAAGTKFQGNDLVDNADTVDGLFTAKVRLNNPDGSAYQLPGDKWLAIKTVGGNPPLNMDTGQPLTNQMWVAVIHMGSPICTIVDNGGGPSSPPVPVNHPPQKVTAVDASGITWVATTFAEQGAGVLATAAYIPPADEEGGRG